MQQVVGRREPLYADPDRSGFLGVRVPARLEELLERKARLNGRSLSAEVRVALALWSEGGGVVKDG
jgi:hypothetical protein